MTKHSSGDNERINKLHQRRRQMASELANLYAQTEAAELDKKPISNLPKFLKENEQETA